jgi:rhodanese-related sulfurtransferase
MTTRVTDVPATDPETARAYFLTRLSVETDCDDVAAALATGEPDFVLLDARSDEAYAAGHLPGAINLHRPYSEEEIANLPPGLIVTYCWGPGCNGASKAALNVAQFGRQVKEMLGGFEYWIREGHPVEGTTAEQLASAADRDGVVRLPGAISCLC